MAPNPTYASPHVQLGRLMIAARRAGLSFEVFWAQAVREGQSLVMTNHPKPPAGCIRWPTDRNDRVAWQKAIYGTREGWRRSYERVEPTPGERAVGVLGEGIGALANVSDARAAHELADAIEPHVALVSAA